MDHGKPKIPIGASNFHGNNSLPTYFLAISGYSECKNIISMREKFSAASLRHEKLCGISRRKQAICG